MPIFNDIKFTVRNYTEADIDQLIDIQHECFPPPYPVEQLWNREQLFNHIHIFPKGAMCVECDGKLVGSSTCLIVKWYPNSLAHTWAEITDNGYIRTHDPEGNTLYGVDIAVRPAWRKKGVAKLMYQARFALVKELNLDRFIAAGRMPGYFSYRDQLSPEEYAEQVIAKKIDDPVLSPQLRSGLIPLQVVHNYLLDEESGNCALLLEWRNPWKK